MLCSAHQCHCRKTDVRDDEIGPRHAAFFPSVAVCEHVLGPHVMQTAMQKENPRFLFNHSLFSVVVSTVSTDLTTWAGLTCLDTRLRIMKSIMKSTTVWSDAERCKMLLIAVLIWTVDSVCTRSHVTYSSTSGFSKRLSLNSVISRAATAI